MSAPPPRWFGDASTGARRSTHTAADRAPVQTVKDGPEDIGKPRGVTCSILSPDRDASWQRHSLRYAASKAVSGMKQVVSLAQQAKVPCVGRAGPRIRLDVIELQKRASSAAPTVCGNERTLTAISCVSFTPHRRSQVPPATSERTRALNQLAQLGIRAEVDAEATGRKRLQFATSTTLIITRESARKLPRRHDRTNILSAASLEAHVLRRCPHTPSPRAMRTPPGEVGRGQPLASLAHSSWLSSFGRPLAAQLGAVNVG